MTSHPRLTPIGPRNRRVLMVVPRPQRDLAGHALVAYYLERRHGHEVVLCTGSGVAEKILEHAPDVVVLDFLGWEDRAVQARLAKRLGMKLVVLPTSGVYETSREEVRVAGANTGVNPLVDKFLAWGDRARDVLLGEKVFDQEQVVAVGCPRFDLYRQPFLSLMEPRARLLSVNEISEPERPLILWATTTNNFARSHRTVIQQHARFGRIPKPEIRAMLAGEEKQFQEHSALVAALAERNPGWNLVIRVHPLEPIEPYLPFLEARPNLHVTRDGTILDWLYHSDVLLQRGSTVAMEAWILQKPVLELGLPGSGYRFAPAEHEAANEAVQGVAEAEAAIRRYLSGSPVPAPQQAVRQRLLDISCHAADGRASERCAEVIHRLVSAPHHSDEDQRSVRRAAVEAGVSWQTSHDGRLVNRLKGLIGMHQRSSLRFWKRKPPVRRATLDVTPLTIRSLFQTYETAMGQDASKFLEALTTDE